MTFKIQDDFSLYDCPKCGFKFEGDEAVIINDTLAKFEPSYNTKTVSKNRRNTSWKKRTKPIDGVIKLSLHLPVIIQNKLYDLNKAGMKENAIKYGANSSNNYFVFTCMLENEDGEKSLRAFPKCQATSGLSEKMDANQDTIEEVEIEIAIMLDESNELMYGLYVDDEDDEFVSNWLSNFDPSMVKDQASSQSATQE